ncbi:MAG: hypothetical protein ACRCX7_11405 [Cetobacterium sp.]|uniref:hypothetical protein n=1 Tax=Cetobacterium sp. TaxID=2071632 RepID=UPI003F2B6DFE
MMTIAKFLGALNNAGAVNLVNPFDIENVVTNTSPVTTVDMTSLDDLTRVLDFTELFIETTEHYGLVINKDDVMFVDGSTKKLKDLFAVHKADKRKIKPNVFDFIEITKCFNEKAIITATNAKNRSSLKSVRGMVKEIKDGIYTVVVGGEIIKLPSICMKRVPRTIMSKNMKEIYDYMLNKGRKPLISSEYNYMDISECGKFIKYIATDRLDRFDGAVWDAELRAKYGTQKKIRGVLKALFDCSDDEMDTVIMMFGSTTLNVEVLEGKDVKSVFDKSSNANSGSLGNSCMLGKPKSYFKIYEDNCKAVIVKDDSGKIILRALLWTLHSDTSRKKIEFLDRIYSKNDSMVPMLLNWAMKQGFYTLSSQTHSERKMVSPKGEKVEFGDYHARLKSANYSNHPYIDTLYLLVGNRAYASGSVLSAHSTGGSAGRI